MEDRQARSGEPVLRSYTDLLEFPPERPSQVQDRPHRVFAANRYKVWLIQRFITSGFGSDNCFGQRNFLFVSLAALIELHLSTALHHVPVIDKSGLRYKLRFKYYVERHFNDFEKDEYYITGASPEQMWAGLRTELDEQRTTLRWMNRFFRKHFNHSNQDLQAAFDDLIELFKLRVDDLEQSDSLLKDHIASAGISKSSRMAEMSIRESKRVMLCTPNLLQTLLDILTLL